MQAPSTDVHGWGRGTQGRTRCVCGHSRSLPQKPKLATSQRCGLQTPNAPQPSFSDRVCDQALSVALTGDWLVMVSSAASNPFLPRPGPTRASFKLSCSTYGFSGVSKGPLSETAHLGLLIFAQGNTGRVPKLTQAVSNKDGRCEQERSMYTLLHRFDL